MRKFSKLLILALTFVLALLITSLVARPVVTALSNSDNVNYKFGKGVRALQYAPTVKALANKSEGDAWQWFEAIFDNQTDLSGADTFLAVEIEMLQGNPGLTVGIMGGGTRWGSYIDNASAAYLVNEGGEVTVLESQYGGYIWLGAGFKGMLLLPTSTLTKVGWDSANGSLANATSFFIETNALYNWGFEMRVGEVGFFNGDPTSASFTKILTLDKVKTNKVINSVFEVEFPEPYPFGKGENGFTYAPTVKALANKSEGDSWQWFEAIFDAETDLSSAMFVGVEIDMQVGNPGLTVGIMGGGTRWGLYTDGDYAAILVAEDGTMTPLTAQYGGYIWPGEGFKGMLLLPLANLTKVGWDSANGSLANSTSFFIEANAQYNWGFEMRVGEVVFFNGLPGNNGDPTKILELDEVKKSKASGVVFTVEFPENVGPQPEDYTDISGQTAEYPFRDDELKYSDIAIWKGASQQDSSDNWQLFAVDLPETDLTEATYLAVHYYNKAGVPGITYGIENNGTRYSNVGSDGESFYLLKEDGSIVKACNLLYDAANVSQPGALLIPMKFLKLQFGSAENTLEAAKKFIMTTNSKYNYAFEIGIGEIGYYTGYPQTDNFEFHKLIDLSNGKLSVYSASCSLGENSGSYYINKIDQRVYGDTTLDFFATGKADGDLIPWEGGAAGTQTMTLDSYGDDALELVCTGPRDNADAYTAFTLADGIHYDYSSAKGITIWARNDSDVELSFNLEIDVKSSYTTSRGRFNVSQGHRFWLYDVNTKKQTIYMTRPCITLPVGFEGWVRIPFDCFTQAEWSITDANYGPFDRQYFMTEGSYIAYIGLTVYSGSYTNKAFAVNKLGSYTETPTFVSALVPASETRKDIEALMGLSE